MLVLGTAQLGMDYGVNNRQGKPERREALAILDVALEGGINTFDTAPTYGESENILGEWIKSCSLDGQVNIISKLKSDSFNDCRNEDEAVKVIRNEIKESLRRLNVGQLDGYLFHSPQHIYADHLVAAMRQIKKEGLTRHIGVSIYDEPEVLRAAEIGVDYIQIPYNLFDRRLDKTDFFAIAKKNKITIFARSPFLQGLLVMNPQKVPDYLVEAKPLLEELVKISSRYNISRAELALRFLYHHPYINHTVVGVETIQQLQEILKLINQPPLSAELLAELSEKFSHISHHIVNPSLWQKNKK